MAMLIRVFHQYCATCTGQTWSLQEESRMGGRYESVNYIAEGWVAEKPGLLAGQEAFLRRQSLARI